MLSDFCGVLLSSLVKITLEDFFNQRKKYFVQTDRQADRPVDLQSGSECCILQLKTVPPLKLLKWIPIF